MTKPANQDSPCVAVCSTTYTPICMGCGRTVDEVAQWATYTEEQKAKVWERIIEEGYPKR